MDLLILFVIYDHKKESLGSGLLVRQKKQYDNSTW